MNKISGVSRAADARARSVGAVLWERATVAFASILVLVCCMSDTTDTTEKTSGQSRFRFKAFWEYLEGYATAFDMYPDYGQPHPYHQDAYRVLHDYAEVTDDFIRVVKARGERAVQEAGGARIDESQARALASGKGSNAGG